MRDKESEFWPFDEDSILFNYPLKVTAMAVNLACMDMLN